MQRSLILTTDMEANDLHEQIRKIKTELRLSMNGVASAYMRENGISYRLNFGVELPRLQMLASTLPHSHELAQALWKENIRECRLLAAMLQPVETFFPELADLWMEDMPNVEIVQHTTQHLFCRLPYASAKAFQWIADERELYQVCGYLILARLFMQGKTLNEQSEHEFLDQAQTALRSTPEIRRSATSAIQKYQTLNEKTAKNGDRLFAELE